MGNICHKFCSDENEDENEKNEDNISNNEKNEIKKKIDVGSENERCENNLMEKKPIIEEDNINIFGIINSGNTCFMNSSLQCLFHLNNFKKYILNIPDELLEEKELTKEFKDLLNIIEKEERMINASKIKKILSKVEDKYKTNEQCDANEFISIFLNQMLNELKGFGQSSKINFPNNIKDDEMKKQFERLNKLFIYKNNSFLIDLFYGRLLKELYCEKGHRISIKFQIYNMIELPINECFNKIKKFFYRYTNSYYYQVEQNNNKVELIDLLKEYQNNHLVDGEIECEKCGKNVKYYSKTTIFDSPQYLIIFLNQNLENYYNSQFVNFEETFNTTGFIKGNNTIYNLVGVIDYFGNSVFQDYSSKYKNLNDKNWYKVVNSKIQLISDFKTMEKKNAIILFYEKS